MSSISATDSGSAALQNLQAAGPRAHRGRKHDAQRQAEFEAAATAAGADPSKIKDIEAQVQQAIKDGKNNAAGGSRADQRKAVESAIDTVLQKNGVDLTKFHAALKAKQSGRGQGGANDPDGDGDNHNAAQTGGPSSNTYDNTSTSQQIDTQA